MRRALLFTLVFALLGLAAPAAKADPTRMLGHGTRGMAQAGAMLTADDFIGAPINNPAMLSLNEGKLQMGVGYLFARPKIDVNGEDAGAMDARGFSVGLAVPFSHKDWDFGFGLSAHLPDRFLLRLHAIPATQPRAVMWDSPPHRMVANLAFSARYKKLVSVGVGASIFGKFDAEHLSLGIDATPGRTRTTGSLDFSYPLTVTPVAGIVITPKPWLRLGARYTGETELSLHLPITAVVTIPAVNVDGPLGMIFTGPSIYSPREIVAGGGVTLFSRLTLSAELSFQNWAALNRVVAGIITNFDPEQLGVEVPASDFVAPHPGYKNTFSPRVSGSYVMDIDVYTLALRAGYAFVPTPVPAQTGLTNFADSNRHVIGLGATFGFELLKLPVALDAALQFQRVTSRTAEKLEPLTPGGDLSIAGMVYGLSAGARVSW